MGEDVQEVMQHGRIKAVYWVNYKAIFFSRETWRDPIEIMKVEHGRY